MLRKQMLIPITVPYIELSEKSHALYPFANTYCIEVMMEEFHRSLAALISRGLDIPSDPNGNPPGPNLRIASMTGRQYKEKADAIRKTILNPDRRFSDRNPGYFYFTHRDILVDTISKTVTLYFDTEHLDGQYNGSCTRMVVHDMYSKGELSNSNERLTLNIKAGFPTEERILIAKDANKTIQTPGKCDLYTCGGVDWVIDCFESRGIDYKRNISLYANQTFKSLRIYDLSGDILKPMLLINHSGAKIPTELYTGKYKAEREFIANIDSYMANYSDIFVDILEVTDFIHNSFQDIVASKYKKKPEIRDLLLKKIKDGKDVRYSPFLNVEFTPLVYPIIYPLLWTVVSPFIEIDENGARRWKDGKSDFYNFWKQFGVHFVTLISENFYDEDEDDNTSIAKMGSKSANELGKEVKYWKSLRDLADNKYTIYQYSKKDNESQSRVSKATAVAY